MAGVFGLIPNWAKDTMSARHTYNARSETVVEEPATAILGDWAGSVADLLKVVALEWYGKRSPHWSEAHAERSCASLSATRAPGWMGRDRRMADIKPVELLAALRKVEKRGAVESMSRAWKQVVFGSFRFPAVSLLRPGVSVTRHACRPCVRFHRRRATA